MASSPLLGWLTSNDPRSTPSFFPQLGSNACSASTIAAMPPAFWASAHTCKAIVVLPLDSGPKISMIRPRGKPIPPSARSSERDPVLMHSTFRSASPPSGMIDPSPNCFSICCRVVFSPGSRLRIPSKPVIGSAGAPLSPFFLLFDPLPVDAATASLLVLYCLFPSR